jgi:hypothetical protein
MENKKLFSTLWGRSWEFGRQKVVMEIFGGKKTIRKSGKRGRKKPFRAFLYFFRDRRVGLF